MPSHKIHCAISKKRTGNDFSELHHWIDEPYKTHGSDHRTVRHAWKETDRKEIQQRWEIKRLWNGYFIYHWII
jgi:hypothetical protein